GGPLACVGRPPLWEASTALGPADGVVIADQRVLPRTTDLAMPHIWDMIARLLEPASRAAAEPLWLGVASAAAFTLGIAAVGWLIGAVVGVILALVMLRSRVVGWSLLSLFVLLRTVPAFA